MGLDLLLLALWLVGGFAGAIPGERFEWVLLPVIPAIWSLTARLLRLRILTVPRHPAGYAVLTVLGTAAVGWSIAVHPLREAVLPACSAAVALLFLLERRSALQGHVIVIASFVAAVIGASVDPGAKSLPVFLPYSVLLFAALALIHQQWVLQRLRRAAQEGYMLAAQVPGFSGTRTGRLPSMALVVGLTALLAMILYVLVPHWRWRRASGNPSQQGSGSGTSGMTEKLSLQGVRDLKLDHRVALRLRLFDGDREVRPSLPLRLRGHVLDRFRGHEWDTMSRKEARRDDRDGARDGWVTLDRNPRHPVRIEVTSEPNGDVLPAPGRVTAVKGDRVYLNGHGSVFLPEMPAQRFSYEAVCDVAAPAPGSYEARPASPDPVFLQLPSRQNDVERLARRVAGNSGSAWETAVRVEQHLRNEYDYSLEVDVHEDPVHALLFDTRAGYCVHFAAAMAVMLRHLEIPCRIVQGFFGGEWSGREQISIFRLSDAHAWVEVWLGPRAGWVAFDPTPAEAAPESDPGEFTLTGTAPTPDGTPRPEPTAPALSPRQLSRLSLESQTRWLNAVKEWSGSLWERRSARAWLLGLVLVASICVTWVLLPRHEQARLKALVGSAAAGSAPFYEEFLTLAARAGYRPGPGETPLEFGRRVERSYPGACRVPLAMYAVRFGGAPASVRLPEVRPILDSIRAAQAGKRAAAPEPGPPVPPAKSQ